MEARTPDESIPAAANRAETRSCSSVAAALLNASSRMRLRGDEPAADGVGGPGDHHRGLPRSGGGKHLDPVVEAHDRSCLLVGERALLDRVEERPPGRELGGHDLLVGVGDQGLQVGVQEADRLELSLGEGRLTPGSTDTVEKSRFGTGGEQRVNGLGRDPPLLGACPGREADSTAACHATASAIAGVRARRRSARARAEASGFVMPRRRMSDCPSLWRLHRNHRRRTSSREASVPGMVTEPDA